MITRDQLIHIGHLNKPHGVNGEINASLLVDHDMLKRLSCIVCDMDGINVPFFVEATRQKGAMTVLLTIDGISDELQAVALVGKDFFALKRDYDQLVEQIDDDDDQLPLDYFIGFTLTDQGRKIGEILAVDESTENVLFVVRLGEEKQCYVPAVDQLVASIDIENQTIDMSLPEGLLDL